MKLKDIVQSFYTELRGLYSDEEIDIFISLSTNEYLGLTKSHLHLSANRFIEKKHVGQFHSVISQLREHKPIQYILGYTEFYKCKIKVNEYVLIPRPETEELVELIINENKSIYLPIRNILDIGTGSGCIAISLKKKFHDANVFAMDISGEALIIAKANAILNQAKINFIQSDILSSNPTLSFLPLEHGFDIIVSNPPYIYHSEKEKMSKNVLDYEPHLALFINDKDPLIFYKTIADFAKRNLSEKGKLYFEINETMGSDVKKLLKEKEFANVEVKKDINGKDRIATGNRQ